MSRVLAVFFAVVLLVFSLQNTESVTFHFLIWDLGPAPLLIAVLGAAVLGLLVGLLLAAPSHFREVAARRRLESELQAADQQTSKALADAEATRARARPRDRSS